METIQKALDARVGPVEARLAALESNHAALESKALKAGGTWQRGTMYAANDIVQHDGSLWTMH